MRLFTLLSRLAVVAGGIVASTAAPAAVVLDVANPISFSSLGAVDRIYQEFHPIADNIAGAGIHIDFFSPAGHSLIFSIFEASDVSQTTFVATGPAIASGSAAIANGWVEAFWTPVALTPGGSYFLNVEASVPGTFDAFSGSYTSQGDLYMYGFDYTFYSQIAFRTYADSEFAFVTADAPEPASLALMGLGLVGVAAARRRGRRLRG